MDEEDKVVEHYEEAEHITDLKFDLCINMLNGIKYFGFDGLSDKEKRYIKERVSNLLDDIHNNLFNTILQKKE